MRAFRLDWRRAAVVIVGTIVLGVAANYAYAALNDTTLPFGDVMAVAIWPLAMILVAAVVIAYLLGDVRSGAAPSGPVASAHDGSPAMPESPELVLARGRLAEMEAKAKADQDENAIVRISEMLIEIRRLRDEFLAQPAHLRDEREAPAGWSRVEIADLSVRQWIGDSPEDLELFDQAIDPAKLDGLPWYVRVATYLSIKETRLQQIRQRRRVALNG